MTGPEASLIEGEEAIGAGDGGVGRPGSRARAELSASDRRLVLSDLVNRVLDKGLAITGSVMLAVADVDLVRLDLSVLLSAVETASREPGPAKGPARGPTEPPTR